MDQAKATSGSVAIMEGITRISTMIRSRKRLLRYIIVIVTALLFVKYVVIVSNSQSDLITGPLYHNTAEDSAALHQPEHLPKKEINDGSEIEKPKNALEFAPADKPQYPNGDHAGNNSDIHGDSREAKSDQEAELGQPEVPQDKQEVPQEKQEAPWIPDVRVQKANCAALFNGDKEHLNASASVQQTLVPDSEYFKMAANCSDFLWRRQYTLKPVTQEEADFPIAFSLLMFKDVVQAERLLRAIYRPQNVYCVHVDRKSTAEVYDAMRAIVECLPNVFMANERFDVKWGAWSVLEPELQCLKQLWTHPVKWKYFINLTGQEFPLKTNHQIVRILKAYNGANNMEGTVKRKNRVRTEYEWISGTNTGKRKPPVPHNITVTKGSVHIVVQRGYVDFLLHDQRAQDFINWTITTDIPDETLFSSLNFSPQLGVPGAYIGEPETDLTGNPFLVRYKNWQTGIFTQPCGGHYVRTICVFGVRDLPMLQTRPELFANKFHLTYQPLALDCMEERHFELTRAELAGHTDFNTTYYETREFVKHHINNYTY